MKFEAFSDQELLSLYLVIGRSFMSYSLDDAFGNLLIEIHRRNMLSVMDAEAIRAREREAERVRR